MVRIVKLDPANVENFWSRRVVKKFAGQCEGVAGEFSGLLGRCCD
jgi:hypothetical protein